jgi:putative membrane protein
MTDPVGEAQTHRFEVRATAESHFSWLRTRLSVERTLMSALRTSIALIGFGFTIVQFFDRMQDLPSVAPARFPEAPRYLGLALIFCGVLVNAISLWEYRWALSYLWGGSYRVIAGATKEGKKTPLFAVTFVVMLVGLFALGAVMLRFV